MIFDRIQMRTARKRITIIQPDKIQKLEVPTNQKSFSILGAMCQYIGANQTVDIFPPVQ